MALIDTVRDEKRTEGQERMLHGSLPLRVAPLPRLNDVMNIYYRKSLLLQWVTPQSILNGGINLGRGRIQLVPGTRRRQHDLGAGSRQPARH